MQLKKHVFIFFLPGLLTIACLLLCREAGAQNGDTAGQINFPLLHENVSLYDYASVRIETSKRETPPSVVIKRAFRPAKEIFKKDEFHFADSVKSFWIK